MTEEKKDVLLRQGNPLTESRYKFTPTEKNAFLVVIKNVRKNYIEREPPRTEFENMRVKIYPKDITLIRDEKHTKEARQALRNLRNKTIEFEDEEGIEDEIKAMMLRQLEFLAAREAYRASEAEDKK